MLISGGAGAHALIDDVAHEAGHASYAVELVTEIGTTELQLSNANQAEVCIHANCGHAVALAAQPFPNLVSTAHVAIPSLQQRLLSSEIANNIERPKWSLTTPNVVSLLN